VTAAKFRSVALLCLFLALGAVPSWGQTGPTAMLIADGVQNLTVGVGSTITYAWSSANAVSAASSYAVDGGGLNLWVVNPLSGSVSGAVVARQVGHTYVITYTVTNASGQIASDHVTITATACSNSSLSVMYTIQLTGHVSCTANLGDYATLPPVVTTTWNGLMVNSRQPSGRFTHTRRKRVV
jgi:hypothetical protein